jgi:hypothetical protein
MGITRIGIIRRGIIRRGIIGRGIIGRGEKIRKSIRPSKRTFSSSKNANSF